MANKDFYDRIADALEVIAGDDSHVDDIDKNMDYYKRIAEALQDIAENGGGGGSSAPNEILVVTMDATSLQLDHTWQEIYDSTFCICNVSYDGGRLIYYLASMSTDNYSVTFKDLEQPTMAPTLFQSNSANEYPHYVSSD